MNYSKALRVLRAAKGISQQDLAKLASLSKSLISKMEAGVRTISQSNKDKLAASLDIPVRLFDILAMEQSDTKVSKQDLETIGETLLTINEEIPRLNEETL